MKLYRSLTVGLFLFLIGLTLCPDASAQDRWTQVRSKNFYLIGNASEKDIRKVGTKLEQFRESFRLLFSGMNLNASIPTNVVVFKNDSAYKPFKPIRTNGKIDDEIAGFFQPGEDVNYITLSAGGDDKETFGTIFHEYVHFIINTNFGRSDVPQWFNEGLAEYYQTFEIAGDIKIKLGLPQNGHLILLQQSQLMPLEQLLNVSNHQLLQTGGHSRSIFYAQSWALVHYITQAGKTAALSKYLLAKINGKESKAAFEEAFQTTYEKMEKDLRNYVSRRTYNFSEITFKQKLEFDTAMTASPLDEPSTNAYLGDLLYHNNRHDDAEPFLLNALKAQPDSGLANTTLGMVKIRQRKFDDARKYLEKAIAGDPKNHLAYYQYAFLLSREGRDEFGYVQRFEPEMATKMRDSLKKAIAINPAFTESYELLAFVSIVNNDDLEGAADHLHTALKRQPGNQRYSIRLAEILSRQKKFDEAVALAGKIAANADDDEMRSRANGLIGSIKQQRDSEARYEAEKKRFEDSIAASGGKPRLVKRIEGVPKPSDEEIARHQKEEEIRSMNDALRTTEAGETRVLGKIEKIDCKKRPIVFTVKTAAETFSVTARDFSSLSLSAIDTEATNAQVGCDANVAAFSALVTYKPVADAKSTAKGELVAVEFVPADFRIMTEDEMKAATLIVYDLPTPPRKLAADSTFSVPSPAEMEAKRREMIIQGIKENLRKPGEGEKQGFGFLEKIECADKAAYFYFRTEKQTIKLLSSPTQQPNIIVYTPDLGGVQFGCGLKPIEFPAVFIYGGKPDTKAKTEGSVLSIEFVPKSFVLQ